MSTEGSSVKGKERVPIIFRPGPTYHQGEGVGKRYYIGVTSHTDHNRKWINQEPPFVV